MPDITVTLVLPSGGTRTAEVPDDVPVKELIPELTTSLELPTSRKKKLWQKPVCQMKTNWL